MNQKLVSILIPCFNEEQNIKKITDEIAVVFKDTDLLYEIIFIDDGSNDGSITIINEIVLQNNNIKFIEFSRNFGKDFALKAGVDFSNADAIVMIDADMQHPPKLILQMIDKWNDGFEVVYAFRSINNPDANFINRFFSKTFYKLVNLLSDINLENGIADYRLIDRKVINSLKKIDENELFLRGMVKWIGFKQVGIPYKPEQRLNGETTYSTKSLFKLAIHGLTSFSTKPLYLSIVLGLSLSFIAFILYVFYVFYSVYFDLAISGWASVIFTIVLFGGLNLIVLGIIGVYVGKLFMQSKNRPNYIVRNTNIQKL